MHDRRLGHLARLDHEVGTDLGIQSAILRNHMISAGVKRYNFIRLDVAGNELALSTLVLLLRIDIKSQQCGRYARVIRGNRIQLQTTGIEGESLRYRRFTHRDAPHRPGIAKGGMDIIVPRRDVEGLHATSRLRQHWQFSVFPDLGREDPPFDAIHQRLTGIRHPRFKRYPRDIASTSRLRQCRALQAKQDHDNKCEEPGDYMLDPEGSELNSKGIVFQQLDIPLAAWQARVDRLKRRSSLICRHFQGVSWQAVFQDASE